MAGARISLGGVVKEIDLDARALSSLRRGASPAQMKFLNAKIRKLGLLKSNVKILCHHTLNVNPPITPFKKSKK